MRASYEETVDRSLEEGAIDPHYDQAYRRDPGAFMYGRTGPWPQPTRSHPLAMAAEVLHPPQREQDECLRRTERNQRTSRVRSIVRAFYNAITRGRARDMTDDVFVELLTTTVYSKYMREVVPAELDLRFHEALGRIGGAAHYYITDFTPMQDVEPYEKMWVAPTITLFVRDEDSGPCRPLAIRIGHLEGKGPDRGWEYIVLTPHDVEAWALAKYFVVQGAAHVTALSGHAVTHLSLDVVNAITKSALPMDHTLFKLLYPHSRLALAVNHATLDGGHCVISQTRGAKYAPYCADVAGTMRMAAAGYLGYPHRLATYRPSPTPGTAYPRWQYPLVPADIDIPSDYGRVLRMYHHTIRGFVREVVSEILACSDTDKGQEELDYIRRWARHIAHWVPGFPDDNGILELDDNGDPYLVAVVTTYIWQVSVAHSLDHQSFYQLHPRRTPFRMRVAPPESRMMKKVRRRRMVRRRDVFRATRAFDMFYRPHKADLLKDVDYEFESSYLRGVAIAFRGALSDTEQRLKIEGVELKKYISLAEIAASIQY